MSVLTMLPSDLRLGDNQLQRIAAIRLVNGVLQDADGLEQVASHPDLAREVRRVGQDLLSLGRELHGLAVVVTVLHGGLDSRDLAALVVENLVDAGVEHVGTSIDSRQTGETLGKFTKTVQRVDIRRLAVPSHGVHVQANPVDGVGSHARLFNVFIGLVEGHRVTNEVPGVRLQSELVVDVLHGTLRDIKA